MLLAAEKLGRMVTFQINEEFFYLQKCPHHVHLFKTYKMLDWGKNGYG